MSDPRDAIEHGLAVADIVAQSIQKKYADGDKEHGGRLWRKKTLSNAWEEALDQAIYLCTYLVWQHPTLVSELRSVVESDSLADAHHHAQRALNMAEMGNVDGIKEIEHADG